MSAPKNLKKFFTKRLLLKAALAALLLVMVWPFAAWWLAERLIVQKPLEKADVIIVLGGSAVYKERTFKAAQLFRDGVADNIVLTNDGLEAGWSNTEKRNPMFVELAQRELVVNGIPADKIQVIPDKVESTKDEALLIGREMEKNGWKRAVIVTSGYHSRRALWLFDLYGKRPGTEFGIASPLPGIQTPEPVLWWISRRGWNVVAGEYIKSAYYSVFE